MILSFYQTQQLRHCSIYSCCITLYCKPASLAHHNDDLWGSYLNKLFKIATNESWKIASNTCKLFDFKLLIKNIYKSDKYEKTLVSSLYLYNSGCRIFKKNYLYYT